MRYVGYVACMVARENVNRVLVGKSRKEPIRKT
jgi:hypothetical protein